MLRAGFIGAGTMAAGHIVALRHVPDVQITSFADAVEEHARERAAPLGATALASLDGLWDQVDAVWVCSPSHLHAEHAVAAIRAGKHVFVERPLAHSPGAAAEIARAGREAGVQVVTSHVLRFWPSLQRMRALLHDGALGDLVTCWSRRYAEASPAEMPWWRRDWRRGGGFTVEWGVQEVDFLRWTAEAVAGPVVSVQARLGFSRPDYPDFDDFLRATLTFQSGASGGLDGGLSAPLGGGTVRAICGSKAMAVTEGRSVKLRFVGDGGERLLDVPPLNDPERRVNLAVLAQDREFVQAILERRDPMVTAEDGLAALTLCHAMHRSAQERREIPLAERG